MVTCPVCPDGERQTASVPPGPGVCCPTITCEPVACNISDVEYVEGEAVPTIHPCEISWWVGGRSCSYFMYVSLFPLVHELSWMCALFPLQLLCFRWKQKLQCKFKPFTCNLIPKPMHLWLPFLIWIRKLVWYTYYKVKSLTLWCN